MKKSLLLTLLPLTFLVAACGSSSSDTSSGTSDGVTSDSVTSADSTSTEVDSTSEDDSDSSETVNPVDSRAYTTLVGSGVEVQIGSYYYTMESQTADPNMTASYNLKGLSVVAGDVIHVYSNGAAQQVWAQSDSVNGVYPNYDERPRDSKYDAVTVTASSDDADMYVHETSSGDYTIWLTPTNDGSSSSGDGTDVDVDNKYTILVDTTEVALSHNETPADPSYDEYFATGVSVTVGQKIQVRDNLSDGQPVWTIKNLDSTSVVGFEVSGDDLVCNTAGTYDIYLKLKFGEDQIYIGESAVA